MKRLSGKKITTLALIVLASSTLISTVSASNSKDFGFTANGKTSVKTAKLFKQLMTNHSNVKAHTEHDQTVKKENASSGVIYTISGKTTKSKARKVIQLFQSSYKIEVIAQINQASQHQMALRNKYIQLYPSFYVSYLYDNNTDLFSHRSWKPQYINRSKSIYMLPRPSTPLRGLLTSKQYPERSRRARKYGTI